MILRRLATHVREQNWTAIAIGFFIVVVGVFIGIQVSNWNERRQAGLEEQGLFSRLVAEAEQARWRRTPPSPSPSMRRT